MRQNGGRRPPLAKIRPMPAPSETLPALEQHLAGRLLAFERLDEAWPKECGLCGGSLQNFRYPF